MEKTTRQRLFLLKLGIQFSIALLLSLAMTAINYGFAGEFVQNWAKAFVVAFIIIPPALRLIPVVARGVRAVIGNASPLIVRSAVAVCVAVIAYSGERDRRIR